MASSIYPLGYWSDPKATAHDFAPWNGESNSALSALLGAAWSERSVFFRASLQVLSHDGEVRVYSAGGEKRRRNTHPPKCDGREKKVAIPQRAVAGQDRRSEDDESQRHEEEKNHYEIVADFVEFIHDL